MARHGQASSQMEEMRSRWEDRGCSCDDYRRGEGSNRWRGARDGEWKHALCTAKEKAVLVAPLHECLAMRVAPKSTLTHAASDPWAPGALCSPLTLAMCTA
eukprot:933478-Pyramimonas_sp.AAC.1